jgi:hypothetical protein
MLCLICIFRFVGYSATEADINQLFKRADSLFQVKQYQLAGIGYDQIAYLSGENIIKTKALIKKADCYLMRKEFAKAEVVLSRVYYADLSDSLVYLSRYKTALASYLNSNFGEAESQVIQAKSLIGDTNLVYNMYPLYVLILNESKKYAEAKVALSAYANYFIDDTMQLRKVQEEIDLIYHSSKIPFLKNPEKAKKLSMILPGVGQLYAGYFWEGALNVTLQLAGLGFTGLCIWQKYYFTGAFVGFSIFQKFYGGGINRAQFLVEKRNHIKIRTFNDEIKKYLFENKSFRGG